MNSPSASAVVRAALICAAACLVCAASCLGGCSEPVEVEPTLHAGAGGDSSNSVRKSDSGAEDPPAADSQQSLDAASSADASAAHDATGPSDATTSIDTNAPSDATTPPDASPPKTYPLDDVLRINHMQVKGTHNSYHLKVAKTTIPQWNYQFDPLATQLDQQGVRQVELDVHYTPAKSGQTSATWEVLHVPFVDNKSNCPNLKTCLGELKKWSDGHTNHHLLYILIEPKDDLDGNKIVGHYDELDAALLAVWPKPRVLRPDDVRGTHKTLRDALLKDGWPTLASTRGKAMFVMLNSGHHRDNYLKDHPNLEDRVLFARGGQGQPWSAVLEMGSPTSDLTKIQDAVKAGYLVRTKADSPENDDATNTKKAAAAIASGAHLISCDRPVPHENSPWKFDLPGGTPSRCNPLVAPKNCTSGDIE